MNDRIDIDEVIALFAEQWADGNVTQALQYARLAAYRARDIMDRTPLGVYLPEQRDEDMD